MIHFNLIATLKSPLMHLSGEAHTWYENDDRRDKRVVRLHMRKTVQVPTETGTLHYTVPKYQGNSWRGCLRFLLGLAILDRFVAHGKPVTKDLFATYLGANGMWKKKGAMNGDQIKAFYQTQPTFWLLGGAMEGRPVAGHVAVSDWIPVTSELIANHTIPDGLITAPMSLASLTGTTETYRTPCTDISQITRRDPKLRHDALCLVDDQELQEMLDTYHSSRSTRLKSQYGAGKGKSETSVAVVDPEEGVEQSEKGKTAADQQIVASEVVWAGLPFYGSMTVTDGIGPKQDWTHLQSQGVGFLALAIERFAQQPYIGGGMRQGYGHVDLRVDAAFEGGEYIENALSIRSDKGVPVFAIHDRLAPYRDEASKALDAIAAK
jgi:CRISPR type IV-associated protein Csf2